MTFGADRRGTDNEQAAKLGVLLVAASSLVVAATVWFLPATPADRMIALGVAAGALLVSVGMSRLSWKRLPARALLLFPALGMAAMTVVAVSTAGISPAYMGFFTVAVFFIASTQSERLTLLALPVLLPFWLLCQGGLSDEVGVKMLITVCIWGLIGHGIARRKASDEVRVKGLLHAAATDPLTGLASRGELDGSSSGPMSGTPSCSSTSMASRPSTIRRGTRSATTTSPPSGTASEACCARLTSLCGTAGTRSCSCCPKRGWSSLTPCSNGYVITGCDQTVPTFSAGIAVREDEEAQETLRRADSALYEAKDRGRDRWSHAACTRHAAFHRGPPGAILAPDLGQRRTLALGLLEGPSAAESPA